MVSVSRALALNPLLVLLDESYEGLSPLVVNAFSEAMIYLLCYCMEVHLFTREYFLRRDNPSTLTRQDPHLTH